MPRKPTGRPPGRPKKLLTARQVKERLDANPDYTSVPQTIVQWQTILTQQGDPIPDGYEPFAAFQDAMTTMIVSRRKV